MSKLRCWRLPNGQYMLIFSEMPTLENDAMLADWTVGREGLLAHCNVGAVLRFNHEIDLEVMGE